MTMPSLPARVRRAVLLRSFFVQGSWNYKVMQGLGMAFAILPVLRHLNGSTAEELDERVVRHAEHFNAHPYFSSIALGALARLEVDGESPDTIRRFRGAIRGPLGALGDRLVWATWLPLSATLALALYWVGLPGWVAVAVFFGIYNTVHLSIRLLGFRLGFDAGTGVGVRLRGLGVSGMVERVSEVLVFLVGLLVGVLLHSEFIQPSGVGLAWTAAAVIAFSVGILGGVRFWRPAAIVTVISVISLLVLGLRAS